MAKDFRQLKTKYNDLRTTKDKYKRKARSEEDKEDLSYKQRLSSKLPDPPIFIDGVDPIWEDWLAKVDRKLIVNEDYYLTGLLEVAYVLLRLGGKAIAFIANRSRRGVTNAYIGVTNLFNLLKVGHVT